MTTTATIPREIKNGNGSTTSFPLNFQFIAAADLIVKKLDAALVKTLLVLNVDYGVTGGGTPPATGTVDTSTGSAPFTLASGEKLIITRDTPETQLIDYTKNDPFPAEVNEEGLDRGAMNNLELLDLLNRSILIDETDDPDDPTGVTLPIPVSGDDAKFIGINPDLKTLIFKTLTAGSVGLPVAISDGGTGAVTSGAALTALIAAGTAIVNTFTKTQSWTKGADIASAATLALGTDGNFFDITGTTTITAFTVPAGTFFMLQFDGVLTLTHSATDLILPGGSNILTAAGDTLLAFAHVANKITVLSFTPATGKAITETNPLTLGTEIDATNGGADDLTTLDFTGIPNWVKRITVMFKGVSTNGTNGLLIQIGPSGGLETSGYLGAIATHAGTDAQANATGSVRVTGTVAATSILHGTVTLTLEDATNNTWIATTDTVRSDAAVIYSGAASKSLADVLALLTISTVGGTDLFDAGDVNLLYE